MNEFKLDNGVHNFRDKLGVDTGFGSYFSGSYSTNTSTKDIDAKLDVLLSNQAPSQERTITKDIKNEYIKDDPLLKLIKLRHVLDPKRFYKKEKINTSNLVQIGTIVDSPLDRFNRLTKKQQKELISEDMQEYYAKKVRDMKERKESDRRKSYKVQRSKRRRNQ